MEFIKKIFIAAAVLAAFALYTDSFARVTKKAGLAKQVKQTVAPVAESAADVEIVVSTEREKIEQAVVDTEKIKTAATLAINDANEQLAQGKISYIKAAQIIGEQQYVIEQAKRQLAQLAGKSIEKVQDAENQESYLTQLLSGAQAAKAGLLEGIGYSSTAQQKAIAQAVIDELKSQLLILEKEYAKKIDAASNAQDKAKLSQELDTIKRDIEKEIYRQQTITEEVTSTNKKLFWSAVGLAGAAVGAALAYQYLGTEAPGVIITGTVTEKQQAPVVIETVTPAPTPIVTPTPTPEPTPAQEPTSAQEPTPELTETPGVIERAKDVALDIYGKAAEKVKGAAASVYEKIKEKEEVLGGSETPEEAAARREKSRTMTASPLLFPVQPPTKLSAEEQEALLKGEGEALGEVLLRPNLVPGETGELVISSDVLPQYREDLMQSAGEALTGAESTLKGTISDADLITEEDLSGVSLNPARYQESVESAGTAIAGALERAAEEQNRQVEEQSPYGLGTGGVEPSEYPALVKEKAESAGRTVAGVLGEAAGRERELKEKELSFGAGGMEPSEYQKLVSERASSAGKKGVEFLRQATEQQVKDVLPSKEFGEYKWNKITDAWKAQTEEVIELGKDFRDARARAYADKDEDKLTFINDQYLKASDKLAELNEYDAQAFLDGTIQAREEFLNALEEFENTRPQAPKTPEQVAEGIKNKEAAQKRLRERQEKKKMRQDKQDASKKEEDSIVREVIFQ